MPVQSPLFKLAVVADTHVPDRVDQLHPRLLGELQKLQPNLILHAGDICTRGVLDELGKIAPVTAVSGNRDWHFKTRLALEEKLHLNGVTVALLHGHGGLRNYLWDKAVHLVQGYRLERYLDLVRKIEPQADVIIFGHTHRSVNIKRDSVLYFNPGSAALPSSSHTSLPSYGVLNIYTDGQVEGQIVPLRGYQIQHGRWTDFNGLDWIS